MKTYGFSKTVHFLTLHFFDRDFLNSWRHIDRRGTIEWFPKSPDLTSLDFAYGVPLNLKFTSVEHKMYKIVNIKLN